MPADFRFDHLKRGESSDAVVQGESCRVRRREYPHRVQKPCPSLSLKYTGAPESPSLGHGSSALNILTKPVAPPTSTPYRMLSRAILTTGLGSREAPLEHVQTNDGQAQSEHRYPHSSSLHSTATHCRSDAQIWTPLADRSEGAWHNSRVSPDH